MPDIATLDEVQRAEAVARQIAQNGLPPDTLWIVDMRGAASVAFGTTLSQAASEPVRLVPTFNHWPAADELIPAEETLAAMTTMLPRRPEEVGVGARPVFLLDSWRLAYRFDDPGEDTYDNRYILNPSDLPDVETLRAQGIRRVVYLVQDLDDCSFEEDDVHLSFLAWERAGIPIAMVDSRFALDPTHRRRPLEPALGRRQPLRRAAYHAHRRSALLHPRPRGIRWTPRTPIPPGHGRELDQPWRIRPRWTWRRRMNVFPITFVQPPCLRRRVGARRPHRRRLLASFRPRCRERGPAARATYARRLPALSDRGHRPSRAACPRATRSPPSNGATSTGAVDRRSSTSGPAYVERLTRIYMDLLRLEPNLNFIGGPGAALSARRPRPGRQAGPGLLPAGQRRERRRDRRRVLLHARRERASSCDPPGASRSGRRRRSRGGPRAVHGAREALVALPRLQRRAARRSASAPTLDERGSRVQAGRWPRSTTPTASP